MSKRNTKSTNTGSPSKRAKRVHAFGGSSADDQDPLTTQLTAPSPTALSTRTLPSNVVPTLITLCGRVFAANLEHLFLKRKDETQEWLKRLPDTIIPRIFSILSATHPSRLPHPFISTFLLRGDPIILSSALPGVSSLTVQALSKVHPSLRDLRLTELDKISDNVVAQILPGFPSLQVLILRGSTNVGERTVNAAAKTCKGLRVVNLGYTSAPPGSIALLTAECLELEVVKLAGVSNITDATFALLLQGDTDGDEHRRPLRRLRSLKLRHTLISELTLSRVMSRSPGLSRLDVSFTPIRQPALFFDLSHTIALEKLTLTSTPLTSSFLQTLGSTEFSNSFLNSLRILQIGALGSSSSSISTLAGSLTLTDQILNSLNDILAQCPFLESISLVGNTKLGLHTGAALENFVRKVGRKCKILNLAGIPRLKSSDLVGLLPLHEQSRTDTAQDQTGYGTSPLQTLTLNNTDVGDDASPFIASCTELTTLELAATKFGYNSLYNILDACTRLTKLDLTSCRGVKVGDRRRFFEAWETNRESKPRSK